MEIQITEQLRSFLLAILLGMAVGVVYDLMRAVRLRPPRLTAVLDLGAACLPLGDCFSFSCGRQTDSSGLYPSGRRRRCRFLFQRRLCRAPSRVGLLAGPGRRAVPAAEPAGAVGDEGLQKNC